MTYQLHQGDCLETLRGMADNSVDAIVTDPPYGLSFMGKKWDYDVPKVEVWEECLRVLKPGGHLLAFAGTRTQHRMAVRIEDAGFEIRDMIAWVYGCLSEDSEVLTEDGWMPYNRAKQKNILAYDLQNDVYQWERPSRWNEYRVESDTAYRIQSDYADQIVSRGHRCIVERGGVLTFVPADELTDVERVPYLQGDFSALPQGRGELLLQTVLREGEGLAQETFSEWQGQEAAREGACWREKPGVERGCDPLQAQGQVCRPSDKVRSLPSEHDEHGPQGRVCDGASSGGCSGDRKGADAAGVRTPHQPRCNGQQAGEPDAVCDQCGSQAVRAWASYQTTVATVTAIEYSGMIWCPTVSTGAFVARRNGKVFITGNSGFPKSLDVSKAIDGKLTTGRSDSIALREVNETRPGEATVRPTSTNGHRGIVGSADAGPSVKRDEPATASARQWQGWGTALKPALEPITMARKPLGSTVAECVLAHGTGALNIDGCRVGEGVLRSTGSGKRDREDGWGMQGGVMGGSDAGRWPANLIHDGSPEVLAGFPDTGPSKAAVGVTRNGRSGGIMGEVGAVRDGRPEGHDDAGGSAARFFYTAKASAEDRDAGLHGFEEKNPWDRQSVSRAMEGMGSKSGPRANTHPTVKPTDLMRYLVRLVTPPGGTVLDPFNGSGSTGKACMLEGFAYIGCELDPAYIEISRARIEHAIALRASGAEKLHPASERDDKTIDLFSGSEE